MRRRWEVPDLYDVPVRVQRCWTRRGAERALMHHWYPTRYWLDYEVRDGDAVVKRQEQYRFLADTSVGLDEEEVMGRSRHGRATIANLQLSPEVREKVREIAAREVVRAWVVAGRSPAFHAAKQEQLRREWPTLWRALIVLVEAHEEGTS